MAQFNRILTTIDSHTAGEPTRLLVGDLPPLRGATAGEKMHYAQRELDGIRALLMNEPCGRQDMYGALLIEAIDPAADFVIFMNTRQYTTMCGHAVAGAATTVVEIGMVQAVEPETSVVFDTPFHQFVLDPDDPFPRGFSLTNSD